MAPWIGIRVTTGDGGSMYDLFKCEPGTDSICKKVLGLSFHELRGNVLLRLHKKRRGNCFSIYYPHEDGFVVFTLTSGGWSTDGVTHHLKPTYKTRCSSFHACLLFIHIVVRWVHVTCKDDVCGRQLIKDIANSKTLFYYMPPKNTPPTGDEM